MSIEFEVEEDGRWIAEIPEVPGVMAYGATKEEAQKNVEELLKHVLDEARGGGIYFCPEHGWSCESWKKTGHCWSYCSCHKHLKDGLEE